MIFEGNKNRDQIMRFIEDRPGSTLYDIQRGLDLNLGTVRYHLLMLSLNHRISAYDDGTKYVRYFKNSNTFTDEEKLIISMLRRNHIREVLEVILKKPGAQNGEVAALTGLQESAVGRYMRMLAVRGIVVRTTPNGERAAYRVCEKYRGLVNACIKRMDPMSSGPFTINERSALDPKRICREVNLLVPSLNRNLKK